VNRFSPVSERERVLTYRTSRHHFGLFLAGVGVPDQLVRVFAARLIGGGL
jgi:hypothetical protein